MGGSPGLQGSAYRPRERARARGAARARSAYALCASSPDDGSSRKSTGGSLTAHKEGTGAPPPDAVLLATGEACPVQAYRVGTHLYATQFHPEPTPADFVERMKVYRNDGYFDADAFDATADRVLAASVTEPLRLLHAFAKAFGEA